MVIEASSFQEARGNHVSELFRLVDFMFSNKDLLSKSLSVVVTKCNKNQTKTNICNTLKKIKEKEGVSEGQLKIINFIISNYENRIALFVTPKNNEKLKYTDEIINCINSSQFNEIHSKFILTHMAKLSCLKLIEDFRYNLSKAINKLYDLVLNKIKFSNEKAFL